jgi:hypothetical protein
MVREKKRREGSGRNINLAEKYQNMALEERARGHKSYMQLKCVASNCMCS